MDYKTFTAIKRLTKRNNLEYLSTELNSLFQQGGLPACQTFIDNALKEIEKGNFKATDEIQETTTGELLDGLAWELDQAEGDPDFKFAKINRPKKHSIRDDLGYIDETDPNNANDHTINSKIELAKIEERVRGLITGTKKKVKSNADKVTKAEEWMNPLMDKITAFDVPKHEDVLNVFKKEYPGFSIEFDLNDLKTPYFAKGGVYKKKSIALAVIFLFEKKHPGKEIKDYTTITKRYKHLNW